MDPDATPKTDPADQRLVVTASARCNRCHYSFSISAAETPALLALKVGDLVRLEGEEEWGRVIAVDNGQFTAMYESVGEWTDRIEDIEEVRS